MSASRTILACPPISRALLNAGESAKQTHPRRSQLGDGRIFFGECSWSISDNRILSTSGGVAFFALLAIFPGIAAVVSLYGLFADASTVDDHLSLLAGILPFGILDLIADQITLVASQGNDTLGTAFVVGLLVALGSANSGIRPGFLRAAAERTGGDRGGF